MSAAELIKEEEVVPTKTKKEAPFKPVVTLSATTTLEGEELKIKFEDDAYVEQAKANGLDEATFGKVVKFHSEFLKTATGVIKDELTKGYEKHKSATGFVADLKTSIADLDIYGDKNTVATVKGVEYHGTGITIKQKVIAPGVKAAVNAAKASVYASFTK